MSRITVEDTLTGLKACLLLAKNIDFANFIAVWCDMNRTATARASEIQENFKRMQSDFIGWFNGLDEEQQQGFVREALATYEEEN
jgi:hypothetical protein